MFSGVCVVRHAGSALSNCKFCGLATARYSHRAALVQPRGSGKAYSGRFPTNLPVDSTKIDWEIAGWLPVGHKVPHTKKKTKKLIFFQDPYWMIAFPLERLYDIPMEHFLSLAGNRMGRWAINDLLKIVVWDQPVVAQIKSKVWR